MQHRRQSDHITDFLPRQILGKGIGRQQQLTARGQPTIRVAYELHSGVVVRFPGVQAVIPTQMRGPLRVVVRTVNGVKQIVVIDDTSGKSSPLETRPFEDEAMQSITRFLKEQMKAS